MADVPHDNKGQLEQIQSGLLDGETIVAVYDAIGHGTGFLGLTNLRVILQDTSFRGKETAITSVPYSRITSVSVVSSKSWGGSFFSSGKLAINVGSQTYEIEFRGNEKVRHVHNIIVWHTTQR